DPDGKYLLTIGTKGQGPGEFGSLSLVRFDKDNNLYTIDATNNRISFFDKDGKYLRQIRMTERFSNPFINSKGFIIANKLILSEEGNIQKQIQLHGLFDDKFNQVVELFKVETEFPLPMGMDASSMGEYIAKVFSIMAFRPQAITTLAKNDFIYLGYPDKYEINVYSPDGQLVKKIAREYDPIPVSEKDKENFVQIASQNLPSLFTEDIRDKAFKNIKYPKYKPAYQVFTLMENGWLAVIVDSVEDEYTLLDLFDQEGKFIAHFKTPIPAEGMLAGLLFFNNGKAYSVVTEDDYKFVKRYSIEIQEYTDGNWKRKK
ncbi:MAG: 6-bladed beta-propeller, partial [Candidatus Aminicenantes bacterium]